MSPLATSAPSAAGAPFDQIIIVAAFTALVSAPVTTRSSAAWRGTPPT